LLPHLRSFREYSSSKNVYRTNLYRKPSATRNGLKRMAKDKFSYWCELAKSGGFGGSGGF
jgi:hypothetical protein